jgi:hypothetical protein
MEKQPELFGYDSVIAANREAAAANPGVCEIAAPKDTLLERYRVPHCNAELIVELHEVDDYDHPYELRFEPSIDGARTACLMEILDNLESLGALEKIDP